MIDIIIQKKDDNYKGMICSGHADYAEHGQDIICSAVSILVINTINAIDKLTCDECEASDDGKIVFDFIGTVSHDAKLLMDTLVLGLLEVQKEYGEKYLKISFKEV